MDNINYVCKYHIIHKEHRSYFHKYTKLSLICWYIIAKIFLIIIQLSFETYKLYKYDGNYVVFKYTKYDISDSLSVVFCYLKMI